MTFIPLDTSLIILGGRTATARKLPRLMQKDVFGIGGFEEGWDKLYKSHLITEVLEGFEELFSEEEIRCLESELLIEIQSPENLQAVERLPQTIIVADPDPEEVGIKI